MAKTNSRIMAGPAATFAPTPAASSEDSVPTGTKKRGPGPAEIARRKANSGRDGRVVLGTNVPVIETYGENK